METKKINCTSCAVKYCNNKARTSVGISYFTMPKCMKRRSKWIEQCFPEYNNKNAYVQNLRICGEHFENKMFLNVNKKNRLTHFAIPALFSDEILAKRKSETDLRVINTHDSSTLKVFPGKISYTSKSLSLNTTSDSSSQTSDHLSYSIPSKNFLRTELKKAKEKMKSFVTTVENLNNLFDKNDAPDICLKQRQTCLYPQIKVRSDLMYKSRF